MRLITLLVLPKQPLFYGLTALLSLVAIEMAGAYYSSLPVA
ncbi:hypothetical protein [Pseudomonas sp. TH15]|nr:hypothetical protein [Pseudomonas sp. TH15]